MFLEVLSQLGASLLEETKSDLIAVGQEVTDNKFSIRKLSLWLRNLDNDLASLNTWEPN